MTNSVDHFETLVSEHYESLFRFALSLTRRESDAQDLTQHTFYVWATKGHQLRDLSKVKTWLYTTLHRAFLESQRKQLRFPHHELEEVSDQLPVLSGNFAERLDSVQVLSALARVDQIYQAAVALYYLEDCSYKDIAAILEVPLGTVKSRIARGIAQLREILLSDDFRDLPLDRDGIPPATKPGAPASTSEPTFPHPPAHGRSRGDSVSPDDGQWVFSATHLREPSAAA